MKIGLKLVICNILFSVIIAVVSLTGLIYVLKFDDKGLTMSYAELFEIRQIFTEIRTSGEPEAEALKIAKNKLQEKGYSYFYYLNEQNVDTNSTDKVERSLADKYYRATNEQSVIFDNGAFVTSMALPSGWLVAVNSDDYYGEKQKTYLYIYIASILVASVSMAFAITTAERLIIVPRLKALNQAMHEVFNGNYEKVMEIDAKGADELAEICAEFDTLRKKLCDSEKENAAVERERGMMISGISHDLRTPLSVIQGYAKGIKDGVAKKIGKENEYIEKVYSTALSMSELIDKLSAFAKMQSRAVMYSFSEHDICEIVNDFIRRNYVQYAARGIVINGIVPQNKSLIVNVDKVQFDRIFQNICDNSLKYKVADTANMQIKVVDKDENVEIYLSDDGPGVKDFMIDYIFENYYRGDPSRSNPVSGSGIGLSVVKNVVQAHKGEVVAYNDNGLTIKITIPRRRKE